MTEAQAREYIESKREYLFPNNKYSENDLVRVLVNSSDVTLRFFNGENFIKPDTYFFISLFVGHLGIDRFLLGDFLIGALKLFTLGGFYIWWIIDLLNMKKVCRAKNCKKIIDLTEKYKTNDNYLYKEDSSLTDIIAKAEQQQATDENEKPSIDAAELNAYLDRALKEMQESNN